MMQGERAGSYDVVTAADVFISIGDLDRIMGEVKRLLRSGGLFGFSLERLDAPPDFKLMPTTRYAHSLRLHQETRREAWILRSPDGIHAPSSRAGQTRPGMVCLTGNRPAGQLSRIARPETISGIRRPHDFFIIHLHECPLPVQVFVGIEVDGARRWMDHHLDVGKFRSLKCLADRNLPTSR